MVLENFFPEKWLEHKLSYAFLASLIYSTVGIIFARFLFSNNSGLAAIAFTSLLILPFLRKLFFKEEEREIKDRAFKQFLKDTLIAYKIYLTIFFGIYLTFMFYTLFMGLLGFDPGLLFKEQLSLVGYTGSAFSVKTLISILDNNWWVLLATFLLALITGDGSIFFITWNASSWGVIFGYRALLAGSEAYGPFFNILLLLIITLPHVLLEGSAYILSAISGSVISDDLIRKLDEAMSYLFFFLIGLLFLFFIYYFIRSFILNIILFLILLYFLGFHFSGPHKKLYLHNWQLLIIALTLFLLGALVESFVLGNSAILNKIYLLAMLR